MKGFRAAVALAFCAGAAAPVAGPVAAVCAGEGGRAALVVDTGAAVTTYCVGLPGGSVSGIELVELAGEQHGLDYSLGFGGEAVCRLEGVGPEGGDCFGEYPEFWGYWHGNGSGGWTWAGTGAGSASVEDGDVEGWSWGAGDNGSNHQAPPPAEHEDVCAPAAAPAVPESRRPRGEPRRGDGGSGSGEAAPPAPDPAAVAAATPAPVQAARAQTHDGRKERERDRPGPVVTAPVAMPAATGVPAVASRPAGDEDEGPPVTGLLGLAATAALGVAVWRGSRRKPGN